LQPLTKDHSFVQKLMDAGAITEEEARAHPRRNLITQSLGADLIEEVEVGKTRVSLGENDCVLLCSDGLTGELEDKDIWRAVKRWRAEPEVLAEQLIQAAKAAGGSDNISVIVLWMEPDGGVAGDTPKGRVTKVWSGCRTALGRWVSRATRITKGKSSDD
jgi:protein phosphatase